MIDLLFHLLLGLSFLLGHFRSDHALEHGSGHKKIAFMFNTDLLELIVVVKSFKTKLDVFVADVCKNCGIRVENALRIRQALLFEIDVLLGLQDCRRRSFCNDASLDILENHDVLDRRC